MKIFNFFYKISFFIIKSKVVEIDRPKYNEGLLYANIF